ncbi:MAG: PASTA domain-containing protein [Chitinispirillaceae bacterium]|nr:PASTA domain-containing protein [Chitinispirillaceae bacterium]
MNPQKRYTISVPVRSFWLIYVPVALGISVAALIGGIVFADSVVMPRIVGIDRGIVVVPEIAGLPFEQGRETLFKAGLLTEIKSREYHSTLPVNSIISQVPDAGTKVKKSRRVLVVLSKGEEFAVVPDLMNMTERQARSELNKFGFQVGEIIRTWDDRHDRDLVVRTEPFNRTTISRDMKVNIVLSKGPKPTSAEMPNIVGEPIAEAKKKLVMSGLKIGKTLYKNDHSLLPGTVISQSIPPGDDVPLGSAVAITVSVIR